MSERSATADREITVTRLDDAPRELVWEMWKEFGAAEGLRQTLWRLNQHLTKTAAEQNPARAAVAPISACATETRYGILRDPFGHYWSIGGPVTQAAK